MAGLVKRLCSLGRREEQDIFATYDGASNVWVEKLGAEEDGPQIWRIFINDASYSWDASDFTEAPVGSTFMNINDGITYTRIAAGTWLSTTPV